MALDHGFVWEVRSTGSDTNGGGFKAGASGTDWSLQDSPQYSVTDGVTAGTTTITSATASFGTDVVGNAIYVSGGTGSVTADWYEITARTNSTTITVDRSTGLTAGTGVTLKIGGAFATIQKALDRMTIEGMTTYVKATAVYSFATGLSFPTTNENYQRTRLIGYTTTRGDNGRVEIKPTANMTTPLLMRTYINSVYNFYVNCNSKTITYGIQGNGQYNTIENCKVDGTSTTTYGVTLLSGDSVLERSEITGTTYGVYSGSSRNRIAYNWIHNVSGLGVTTDTANNCIIVSNLITNVGSDGISIGGIGQTVIGNTVYASGGDGIDFTSTYCGVYTVIKNNLLVNNAGYGVTFGASDNTWPTGEATTQYDYNAFYNNTSGARRNITAGAHDVTLSGDPFTAAGSSDWSLNNTAGAGASCRKVGVPAAYPGLTSPTNNLDIGAYQHADPSGGSGGVLIHQGMDGGING